MQMITFSTSQLKQGICHHCNQPNLEGIHKCQRCFKWLIGWTDGRIGTELCRLESTAKATNGIFALDRIDFEKQHRAKRATDRTKADQRRAGRSNFGNVRDAAGTHAGRYAKMCFSSTQDRMERDPYYCTCSTTPVLRSRRTAVSSWR